MSNPLEMLGVLGQSLWLDSVRRCLVTSGELRALIERDGVRGACSKPVVVEKALRGSVDYEDWLEELRPQGLSPSAIYERLTIRTCQAAADVFRRVYDETEGHDGYVSLGVSPRSADDAELALQEARRLWEAANRPNLMIQVPATEAGLSAFEQLMVEGINVHVTLIASSAQYRRVVEAYLRGLERRREDGEDLTKVASVASILVSPVDEAVDARLRREDPSALEGLAGRVAIANARLVYRDYQRSLDGGRWRTLEAKGARKQRLLWASTAARNPTCPETHYVDALIGIDTVDALAMATLNAYRERGRPERRLEAGYDEAERTLAVLGGSGIDLEALGAELTRSSLRASARSFARALSAIERRAHADSTAGGDRTRYSLPRDLEREVLETLDQWEASAKMRRLWEGDTSLWTGHDEGRWLGWLSLTDAPDERAAAYRELTALARSGAFDDAVLLGMGGSSLGPDVLATTFGRIEGFPDLHVLDSTDPGQVRAVENRVDLVRTLFIVSSKSGTTLEPNILMDYFFDRVSRELDARDSPGGAGSRFLAVTDPGSNLEEAARRQSFARVFYGMPSVGGRFSVLSSFGMVPAALMGLDAGAFLDHADVMAVATSSCVPLQANPGAKLGIVLGVAAKRGRDKLTLIVSPGIRGLGAWLEQLIAESTGKQGKGIIPVDGEAPGPPSVYGRDRLFVYVRLESDPESSVDESVEALERGGHPVVRMTVRGAETLGREFFRWELATAVAGSVLGINPFDQPDVEASKVETRKLTAAYEGNGALPAETPFFEEEGIQLFADERNVAAVGRQASLSGYLRAHLERVVAGDYFAVLAFVEMNAGHETTLQSIRLAVRDRKRVATCVGFGPRFLHSTGQAYKGGPASGVFLQITCADRHDLPVPGRAYTFGVVKAAQARGDFAVLGQRGRRALRVHLTSDVEGSLRRLERAVSDALS